MNPAFFTALARMGGILLEKFIENPEKVADGLDAAGEAIGKGVNVTKEYLDDHPKVKWAATTGAKMAAKQAVKTGAEALFGVPVPDLSDDVDDI